MNRRQFVTSSAAVSAMALGGGYIGLNHIMTKKDLSLDTVLDQLSVLENKDFTFVGQWNAFQTLTHMKQSIDFSMFGFPEHKSDLFKSTAGVIAYSLFSSQGSMSHNLAEPIPGTKKLDIEGDAKLAVKALITSIEKFKMFKNPLEPHFAFGELSKREYEIAHALHIHNHFDELKIES